MINWILVALIILAGFIFLKISPGARFGKTWTILTGVIIVFIALTFGFVITRPGVEVGSFDGFLSAIKLYFSWLGNLLDNASGITGDAINTDWTANLTDSRSAG